jgi:hypothetical protein
MGELPLPGAFPLFATGICIEAAQLAYVINQRPADAV